MVDWPDSDYHFTLGLGRLTRMDTAEPRHMRLTDDRLFDHPWVYATQAGYWGLNPAETKQLGEYLLRGGFLVVDDFWGPEQWEVFRLTMDRALPGAAISDIMETDSVMHVVYDIQEKDRTYIPGTRHLRMGASGPTIVQQLDPPAWRAIHDPKDRVVVA